MQKKSDAKHVAEPVSIAERTKYGELAGMVGIFSNVLLSVLKFWIGTVSGSLAISADAVNNLSDAASSVLTFIGFRVAKKPADKNHPYGHGRIEYVTALLVSFFILWMGLELLKSAVVRIFHPTPVSFHAIGFWALLLSILVKIGLSVFQFVIGKKIHSAAANASAKDSLSDTFATSVALLSLVTAKFVCTPIDGYFGLIVSGFVFWAGISVFKETVSLLLGKPPSKEFLEEIEQEILSFDGVLGVHDLLVHDYGPGRLFASADAELPANIPVLQSHAIIDKIEREIHKKYDMIISIHVDPVVTDDERCKHFKEICQAVLQEVDPQITFHDFQVIETPTRTNFIFDIVLPVDCAKEPKEITDKIQKKLSKIDERFFSLITVDHAFH